MKAIAVVPGTAMLRLVDRSEPSITSPDEVYQLMDLFPQTMQQRPSVQYIPVPYKKVAGREKTG